MTATVAGYSHVAICVSDVDKARDFYSGTLGLPEAERPDFGFPGAWYQIGPLQLHLMQRDVPEGGKGIGPHFALWIPTDEFQDDIVSAEPAFQTGAEVLEGIQVLRKDYDPLV